MALTSNCRLTQLARLDEFPPTAVQANLGRKGDPMKSGHQVETCVVLENTRDAVFLLDLNERIQFVSRSVQFLLGYSPNELLGRHVAELFAQQGGDEACALLSKVNEESNSSPSRRICVSDKSEKKHIIEASCFRVPRPGTETALLMSLRDVTETVMAEEARRQSEERFAQAFNCSPLPITICTVLEGRYLEVNDAFLRMLGYEREELLGNCALQLGIWVDPADRSHFLSELQSNGRTAYFEAPFRTKSGEVLETVIAADLIQLEETPAVLAIIQDVTYTKRREAHILQAQKMEALGRLSGGIAHELNNILAVILGYTELAADQVSQDDCLAHSLDQIKAAAKNASGLSGQLLAFGTNPAGIVRSLDLNEVVTDTTQLLKRIVGEDRAIFFYPANPLPSILADSSQIGQILMNLAANSRDAMPVGGDIRIETAVVELDEGSPGSRNLDPRPYVMLTFTDTGCGMNEETQLHIFEPFFTTKRPGAGTGLGLSTVYRIVRQSGGQIWVYSQEGSGTTFRISFPVAQAPPSKDSDAIMEAHPTGESEAVMVVEDDKALRRLTVMQLAGAGYTVIEADSGESALELLDGRRIDLLLADVIMPNMSGDELAVRTRAACPGLRVLLMSGYSEHLIAPRENPQPQFETIAKPFTRRALLAKIQAALQSKREA